MKSKTKTYQVQMIRTSTKSSIRFLIEALDAFKAIKLAEDTLVGWIPVKVNRGAVSGLDKNEEE